MKHLSHLPAALVCALACTHAVAAPEAGAPDFYAGVSFGAALVSAKNASFDGSRTGDARASSGLFVGARLGELPLGAGPPVHLELGYQKFARARLPYTVGGVGTELTSEGRAWYAAAKLDVPITTGFALYGKLGVARSRVDGSTPPSRPVIDIDGRDTGMLTSLGMQYAWPRGPLLRAELTGFASTSDRSRGSALNAGLAWLF